MKRDSGPHIRDVLTKQYELNEQYQDKKTQAAWVATYGYVAFSIALFSIWNGSNANHAKALVTIIVISIFSGAVSYVALQFRHRWESVTNSEMYDFLINEKWRKINDESDLRSYKNTFRKKHRRNLNLGNAKKRKSLEILLMTPIMPVALILHLVYSIFVVTTDSDNIHEDDKYPLEPVIKKTVRSNNRRRRRNGLIDSRYLSEIPAYTIIL